MDNKEVVLLKKALERQKKARVQAEQILESKSKELYDVAFHLKESNARLENLICTKTTELDGAFVNIIDSYVVMDLQFNVISMNSAAKEFFGYDAGEEFVNLSKLVHPDYLEYNLNYMKNLLQYGTFNKYRSKLILNDKSVKLVEINGSLIYDKDKNPVAAHGIVRDITRDEEVKHLLSAQKKQLDIIVENSPLGIILTNGGRIIRSNKTFEKLTGYTELELKKLNVSDISVADDVEESDALIKKMQSGEIDNFTLSKKYTCKDGSHLWAKTSVNVYKNEDDDIDYQVAMIEDISAQHELEVERTQLLEELEKSNKGLQEYAHIVSHDLKSPLRSISALATWLYDDYKDKLDENGVSQLRMMQEKVESMDKLIVGILKYSTVSSDNVHNTDVDVNEVIKEITDIIFIPDHVEVKIVKKLPTLFADKTKIHQLFQNFLSNAVVHIENEVGIVNIDYAETDTHWQFSIEDNGVGIPKEYHEKIFKIFQSVGNNERSTGIGLSIVKKVIDLYEGKVWLESAPGEGTTFYFTIKK
ncbi:PAS domain S-box protein [Aurantibacter sp.]|uniref:PAS domain-containing sensor histidine kinase n=1 Tax=Aurantibacter sp. TaxID=2807103 RepID=UPI003266E7E4